MKEIISNLKANYRKAKKEANTSNASNPEEIRKEREVFSKTTEKVINLIKKKHLCLIFISLRARLKN